MARSTRLAIGTALAEGFLAAGEDVLISNSRGPESLSRLVSAAGPGLTAATVKETAEQDIVVLAVPWKRLKGATAATGLADWEGRIVIDATNPLGPPDFKVADLGGRISRQQFPGGPLPTLSLLKEN